MRACWVLIVVALACGRREPAPPPAATADAGAAFVPVVRWPAGSLLLPEARLTLIVGPPRGDCVREADAVRAVATLAERPATEDELWLLAGKQVPADVNRALTAVAPAARAAEARRALVALAACHETSVVDVDARSLYRPGELRRRDDRLQDQVSIVITAHGDLLRARTAGMARYALPDLVLDGFTRSVSDAVADLLILAAQTMVEEGALARAGRLTVDAKALNDRRVADALDFAPNASRVVEVSLIHPRRVEGDPATPLIEVHFAGGAGPRVALSTALLRLFGPLDERSRPFEADAEFEDAVAKARAALVAERDRVVRAMADGASLSVVGTFASPEGVEHLWVDVRAWKGALLEGVLDNAPEHAPGLRRGSDVELDPGAITDWKLVHRDGRTEGRTVMDLLDARERPPAP